MRLFCTLLLIFLSSTTAAYADKLKVVATFSILGDMVDQIGGEFVDLTVLVGPNSDVHTYEPTPANVKSLGAADLIVVNGLALEGWLGRLIVASGYSGPVVIATNNVNPLHINGTLNVDPHAWQSVMNAKIYATNICNALITADPKHTVEYKANTELYMKKLEALDAWALDQISHIPPEMRQVITTHDAFQYFAKAYNVNFIAPLSVGNEGNPSAADITHLINQIRTEHVQALFLENVTDNRLINQLEKDGGAYIGGTLYSDALSQPNGPAPTYIAMFTHNVQTLAQGMMHNKPVAPVTDMPDKTTVYTIP